MILWSFEWMIFKDGGEETTILHTFKGFKEDLLKSYP